MSALQRSLMAKPPSTEASPSIPEEDAEGDSSSASSISSAGTLRPSSSQRNQAATNPPLWRDYFAQELYLEDKSESGIAKYHVYFSPPRSWDKDAVFVCHHGAASSGLSFALFAAELRRRMPGAGVLAVDARGHGGSVVTSDGSLSKDFSRGAMGDDLLRMIELTGATAGAGAQLKNLLLVGHSLGGAIVTDVANRSTLGSRLVGYAVIDVVEGSAIEALKGMHILLEGRPASFPSVEAAIEWHVRGRTIRNPASAQVSTPALLQEEQPGRFVWNTDLRATQPYWEDWFTGMSSKFLTGKGAKLLLLAGTDRLDKELMIGQMQGKFQLQVFPEAGHFVQEDVPEKTADIIAEFYKRNDRSTLVLPPKVSDLLKQGKKV